VRIIFSTFLFLLFGYGCALPPSQSSTSPYVSVNDSALIEAVRDGLGYANQGRFINAEFSFRKALFYSPENFDVQLNLATVLGEQRIYSEAKALLRHLLLKSPGDMRVLGAVARLAVSEGDYESAKRFYHKILEVIVTAATPEKYDSIRRNVLLSLSTIAFRLGMEEEALCNSELALRDLGRNVEQSARHANLLLATGHLDQMQEYLESLQIEPLPQALLHQKVLLSFELGDDDEAASLCEAVLLQGVRSSNFEVDCLWIIALAREFQILRSDGVDISESVKARGFSLPHREYAQEDLFTSFRLMDELLTTQDQVEGGQVQDGQLFAYPGKKEAEQAA